MTTRASGSITRACQPRAALAAGSLRSHPASSASPLCRRRSTMRATASARSGRSPISQTRWAATRTLPARGAVMRLKSGFAARFSAAIVCALLAGVLEAQTPKYGVTVNVDDKKADFASFKTYAWQRGQASFDKAIDTQIVAAVDDE